MRIYLAGPLFSEGERAWLDAFAARLRDEGHDVFVPHEQFGPVMVDLDPREVFATDAAGVRSADALVAWLDGPMVDDGTAAEVGMFAQMIEQEPGRRRALIGVSTDLRAARRRGTPGDGVNLFVHGAIATHGTMCWSVDEAIETLRSHAT